MGIRTEADEDALSSAKSYFISASLGSLDQTLIRAKKVECQEMLWPYLNSYYRVLTLQGLF